LPDVGAAPELPSADNHAYWETSMKATPGIVREWNEAFVRLQLTLVRLEELPVELEQLSAAAESIREDVRFDVDPFDFHKALLNCMPCEAR
jgi:hypothetical protein